MEPRTWLPRASRAGGFLVTGVLALALLSWLGCGSEQSTPDGVVQRERVAMGAADPTTEPPLDELVPDAERIRLPVPAAENVGTLPGTAGVVGGAATYTIEIEVPPGRRGMQPDLALRYSSRTGPGIAGVGWSLAGTSRIYRCPRTVAQDGETHAVDFSLRDRLCQDGERLVLVRGRYGQADSEYRTERERFARITLVGDSVLGLDAVFRVEHKSGRIGFYGAVDDRNGVYQPPGARAPLAWTLRRVEDRQGNAMHYHYGASVVSHVLRAIRYTGRRATPGDRRVEFVYERAGLDAPHGYRAGARHLTARRLAEIRTHVSNRLVRRYVLA